MLITRIHTVAFLPEPFFRQPGDERAIRILDAARHHLGHRHLQVQAAFVIEQFAQTPKGNIVIEQWFKRRNHQARVAHNVIEPVLSADAVHPALPELAILEWSLTGKAQPLHRLDKFRHSKRDWLRFAAEDIIDMMMSDQTHPAAYRPFAEHFAMVTTAENVANVVILRPDRETAERHLMALYELQAQLDRKEITPEEFQRQEEQIGISDPKHAIGYLFGECDSGAVYDLHKNYVSELLPGDHQIPLELFAHPAETANQQPTESESTR